MVGIGGAETRDDSGLNSFADRYGFVVAYADPFQITTPPNDAALYVLRIKYLSGVIDELKRSQNIDPTRVYVTGGSKGGVEAYRVACNLAAKVTAIGSVAGALLTNEMPACKPSRPISVLEVHGTADTAIPYNGSQFHVPAMSTMAFFGKVDGCPATPTVTVRGRVTTQTWGPCKQGTAVRLVTYAGGDHGWPRNSDIDATAQLWSFFATHTSPSTGATAAGPVVMSLRVRGKQAKRTLLIRLRLPLSATVHASVVRAGRSYGKTVFHAKVGIQTLRLRLSPRPPAGIYSLRLTVIAVGAPTRSFVRLFRVPPG